MTSFNPTSSSSSSSSSSSYSSPPSTKRQRSAKSPRAEVILQDDHSPLTKVSDQISQHVMTPSSSQDVHSPTKRTAKRTAAEISGSPQASKEKTPKKLIDLETALSNGYFDLFGGSRASLYKDTVTPLMVKAINQFRNATGTSSKARLSKKLGRLIPFTFHVQVLPDGEVILELYGDKASRLGEGAYRTVKKSYTLFINSNNKVIAKETVLPRLKKDVDILEATTVNRLHNTIYQEIKRANPHEKIYVTPPVVSRTYQPPDKTKSRRLESSRKRFKGSMFDIGKTVDNATKFSLLIDACKGVKQLHQAGYVHGDVKSENILVNKKLNTAYVDDFDNTQKLGVASHWGDYFPWDHLREEGVATPNCDVFSLALTAASEIIPNFAAEVTSTSVTKGDVVSKQRSYDLFKDKLETHLKDPVTFFVDCLDSAPPSIKLKTFKEWRRAAERSKGEVEFKLAELYPAEMRVLAILIREFENSKRLLKMHEDNIIPYPLTPEMWKEFSDVYKFTSAEKIMNELTLISKYVQS